MIENNINSYNNELDFNNDLNKTLIYFICIYFGFKIFSQILSLKCMQNFSSQQEVLNFTASAVLFLILYVFKSPTFNYKSKSFLSITVAIVLCSLYTFAKNKLNNESKKEKENNINSGIKSLLTLSTVVYFVLIVFILIVSFIYLSNNNRLYLLLGIVIIVSTYLALCLIRNKNSTKYNFDLELLLYLSCFMYFKNISINNNIIKYLYKYSYNIIFFSAFALFSFFGVKYIVGDKEVTIDYINRKNCKSLLGLNEDYIQNQNKNKNDITNRNMLRNIFICFIVVICTFIAIISYIYFYLNK